MKSNFFFANSAVSSIFLTPVSKLIRLRGELVNKLDMIAVVCVLSSRNPEADSRLYDTLLLTRDLVGYIEQEINRRYLERTGSVPEDDDYKFFRENMDDILYEESILRNLDSAPLEIAMQMDPNNRKYQEAYGKLNAKNDYAKQAAKAEDPYAGGNGQPVNPDADQMGGNVCSNCISCCYTYLCVDCLFSLCCGCR